MSTEAEVQNPDRIEQFFERKTVLITGATGFLGKVLLEKLLRACPKVKYVVTLVRTKKGLYGEERMEKVLNGPLFDKIREECPEQLQKVIAIRGDISKVGFNLTKEDRDWLCEEVEIVFHCAATIRFDEPFRKAVIQNVRGTKEMLDLAKKMRNLQVFQHVSTAYCHLEEKELFERTYEPPANPHDILKICELLQEEDVELLAPKLLMKSPNPYAFTKALGEALVEEEMNNLPVLIIRLSVLVPIWKEPICGWTDNLNGAAGILIGAGKGVIRTMYIKPDSCADYMPVDVAANAMLCIAFITTLNPEKRIFHVTSDRESTLSYKDLLELGRKVVLGNIPLPGVVWYPGGSMKESRFYNNVCIFLFHTIPAILVDTILYLLGFEPILTRVQRRINKGFEVFEYYANNDWRFNNQESLKMRDMMNSTEKRKYKLDKEGLDYEEYMTNSVLSVRKYMLNEPPETIPACRRKLNMMWLLDGFLKILFIYAIFHFLFKHFYSRIFSSL